MYNIHTNETSKKTILYFQKYFIILVPEPCIIIKLLCCYKSVCRYIVIIFKLKFSKNMSCCI